MVYCFWVLVVVVVIVILVWFIMFIDLFISGVFVWVLVKVFVRILGEGWRMMFWVVVCLVWILKFNSEVWKFWVVVFNWNVLGVSWLIVYCFWVFEVVDVIILFFELSIFIIVFLIGVFVEFVIVFVIVFGEGIKVKFEIVVCLVLIVIFWFCDWKFDVFIVNEYCFGVILEIVYCFWVLVVIVVIIVLNWLINLIVVLFIGVLFWDNMVFVIFLGWGCKMMFKICVCLLVSVVVWVVVIKFEVVKFRL